MSATFGAMLSRRVEKSLASTFDFSVWNCKNNIVLPVLHKMIFSFGIRIYNWDSLVARKGNNGKYIK